MRSWLHLTPCSGRLLRAVPLQRVVLLVPLSALVAVVVVVVMVVGPVLALPLGLRGPLEPVLPQVHLLGALWVQRGCRAPHGQGAHVQNGLVRAEERAER